ncbi:PAS domain-containing protein [Budviciaceae bacterium BWR-B9]|uniref:PAS domain-containing protein n=1 Tax=Limnobaculum allomyrinae TaxID=2791986 RepID=A0ABS1IWE2_9GAMM|nr:MULTISPECIES: PAS domain-containing protein [Limnobaculum]MBK5145555.1 PAS domain-containing protein [Limnobaculum allomyrinae]MBV7693673.1 PAS domain-containing protein [Limnobaculum sp. M2-1]
MAARNDNDPSLGSQPICIDQIQPLVQFLSCSNEPWGIKDIESKFIYANNAFHDLLGLPKNFAITGLKDSDLPAPYSDFYMEYQSHEESVLKDKKLISSFEIKQYRKYGDIEPYLFDKFPLLDEEGNCNGIVFHGRKFIFFSIKSLLSNKLPYRLSSNIPTSKYTHKEWMIIILMLNGFTIKSMVNYLVISDRTIRKRIERIYKKANVNCLDEFITYCEDNSFNQIIPQYLLKETFNIVN